VHDRIPSDRGCEKRRNIPPAAIAAEGRVPAAPKLQYSCSPRLDPVLRFDPSGAPDKLGSSVKVTVEIEATRETGAPENVVRTHAEIHNARVRRGMTGYDLGH